MRKRLTKYSWSALSGDVFGGFIASLIAFPYGLAMASLMGLPPILGVFTSILTAPITALLGRNPVMIGGVSSVTVPFILVAVHDQGIGGAAKVSMVAAVLMLVFSTLRLGRYVALVPHPVMAGFLLRNRRHDGDLTTPHHFRLWRAHSGFQPISPNLLSASQI